MTATFPFIALAGFVRTRAAVGNARKLRVAYERGGQRAVEAIASIQTVASLGAEPTFFNEYCDELAWAAAQVRRDALYGAIVFGITQILSFGTYALAFYVGSVFNADGTCAPIETFKTILVVVFSSQQIGSALTFLGDVDAVRLFVRLASVHLSLPRLSTRSAQ